MYKLNWKTYNNPHGWVEVTNYCQLSCPGCYRGLDKNPKRQHEDLNKLKKDIDTLIKLRGIKLLTISGGEPLMYPDLDEVIEYAKSKSLKVRLLTNGLALTKKRLDQLNADEVLIHVSEYQTFPEYNKEKFVEMFRGSKTMLGFCITVSEKNVTKIPRLLNYFKDNADVVSRVVLSAKADIDKGTNEYQLFEYLCGLVREVYEREPSFYLGKTRSDKKSWVYYNYRAFPRSLTALKTYLNQIRYFTWRLPIPLGQMIVAVNLPEKTKNGWDLCDGCPDAMIHEGKLVPSCLLERIKKGEQIWIE